MMSQRGIYFPVDLCSHEKNVALLLFFDLLIDLEQNGNKHTHE